MNILLLGSGGREHALAWKMRQSPLCERLFIAPGNAGTAQIGENVSLSATDFPAIKSFVLDKNISLVIVGPEEPLVKGVTDFFRNDAALSHVAIIGPAAYGAQLEGSKAFAKKFMARHNVPTAQYAEITSHTEGVEFLKTLQPPYVLKADGLAAGKGVLIINDLGEAIESLKVMLEGQFGDASRKVVIEEFLDGIEFSVFALTDGKNYVILPEAKDYKRIGEGDTGLNTGGMGAVSPVPFVNDELWQKVEERIVKPTINGLHTEGIDYVGFVFFGLIRVGHEPMVIEYNCRMGDPETEVVMPRLKNDLVDLFQKASAGRLSEIQIEKDKRTATTIVLTAGGYPNDYKKGDVITNTVREDSFGEGGADAIIFHAGTKKIDNQIVTNGGRVMAITAYGDDIPAALSVSNKYAELVQFDGKYFRRDIGLDLLKVN
ncbi:MAG: phosphoribosylamine--glycine ligase [Saprospiraceae bacterium]|nr:phosphoribosylamine--glycine ligase [Saprospiraceae bacterium]